MGNAAIGLGAILSCYGSVGLLILFRWLAGDDLHKRYFWLFKYWKLIIATFIVFLAAFIFAILHG
jgi:hypothetical protein